MGLRFRRSIRLLPGIKINFSKSGVSVSLGGSGLTTNISKKGRKTTVGLPGSGLSYSGFTPSNNPNASTPFKGRAATWIWIALVIVGLLIFGR